ncbi:hypothetical protein OG948_04530 [Embleya sp. NBC_00888]|uniref:hypothetical protein n=1 Tax=Embleya sp. NBC_00888 TaxID=2975960 RepID=UPI00386F4D2A|nr:hypothetical protein OG948_04530 [Embleya sp. NBC_00888]
MNRHLRNGVGVTAAFLTACSLAAGAPVSAHEPGPGGGPTTLLTPGAGPRGPLPEPKAATNAELPPWPVPQDSARRGADAGLKLDKMEGAKQHFHVHLDIFVGLDRVLVPPDLGIDKRTGLLADLHTHDDSGVLHVESHDPNARFVLGQLFAMWNVRFDENHLGALTPDATHTFRTYLNGELVGGDPARIELRPHDQISVMYQDDKVRIKPPASYDFPTGL